MEQRYKELETLVEKFVRQLPQDKKYETRLEEELEIIARLGFAKHFLRVVEILNLTKDIPHITRGSAGSSLICWLLGISDIDPVQERIPLARFMNPKRDDLPDIDLDFPHWQQETVMNRQVFFVHGGTDTEQREKVRQLTELENSAIIVASVGTFSTGINIRNLHNIIFASPSKSKIRNLQSIGRGLRMGETKDSCNLYDIADDLSWKSHKNYTLLHMIERIKIYNEESFNYNLIKVKL